MGTGCCALCTCRARRRPDVWTGARILIRRRRWGRRLISENNNQWHPNDNRDGSVEGDRNDDSLKSPLERETNGVHTWRAEGLLAKKTSKNSRQPEKETTERGKKFEGTSGCPVRLPGTHVFRVGSVYNRLQLHLHLDASAAATEWPTSRKHENINGDVCLCTCMSDSIWSRRLRFK